MKNKILFWLITVFTIVNIADAVTAFFILPGEANPIFLMLKSIYPVLLLKLGVVLFFWWLYKKNTFNTEHSYFNVITILVLATFMVCIGVASNVYGMTQEGYVDSVKDVSPSEKAQSYFLVVTVFYLLPWMFSSLSFWIYNKSKKVVKIDRNFLIPKRFKKVDKDEQI